MLLSDYRVVAMLDTGFTLVNKNQNSVYSYPFYGLAGKWVQNQ